MYSISTGAAGLGISPPNFFVSTDEKILGAGLSTSRGRLVNRQSVQIQVANFQFASRQQS